MRLRHQSAAESAAAFIESRQSRAARKRRARARAVAAGKKEKREPADHPSPGPFVMLRLPAATHYRLVEHCREFGLRPHTFIEKMLDQAALSRGGA